MTRFICGSMLIGHLCQQISCTSVPSLCLLQTETARYIGDKTSLYDECTQVLPPSVFYLGLPHAGSSSMAKQMNMHPEMSFGRYKEHRLWVGDMYVEDHEKRPRSLEDYHEEFTVNCFTKLTFDATPFMLLLGKEDAATNCTSCGWQMCNEPESFRFPRVQPGPAAILDFKKSVPSNAKFLAMFRDPMDTEQYYPYGAVEQPCHACDADNLERWLNVFPKENFLFIDANDYFKDEQKIMDGVFKFLGVEPMILGEKELEPSGRRRSTSVESTTKQARVDFWSKPQHRECKQRLEKMTGLKFSWEEA